MRRTIHYLILAMLALPALRAAAYAPVIGQFPSPVIGNQVSTSTAASRYVYADAFDLLSLATDDQTPPDLLKWSYEIVGTPKYAINGAKTANSTLDEHLHPSADQDLYWAMNTLPGADDINPDGRIYTVTLRNIALYPYGGTPSTPMPRC